MKKLTGPKIYKVKTKLRKLANFRLDMAEAGLNNIRKIIKGTGIPYMTAVNWLQQIKAQEREKRFRRSIII